MTCEVEVVEAIRVVGVVEVVGVVGTLRYPGSPQPPLVGWGG